MSFVDTPLLDGEAKTFTVNLATRAFVRNVGGTKRLIIEQTTDRDEIDEDDAVIVDRATAFSLIEALVTFLKDA